MQIILCDRCLTHKIHRNKQFHAQNVALRYLHNLEHVCLCVCLCVGSNIQWRW